MGERPGKKEVEFKTNDDVRNRDGNSASVVNIFASVHIPIKEYKT